MISETITRNDLTAILNEVLPPTPSEYQKLLWTNPSPTSAFAAQTISLDLSNYDAVDVEFRHWTDKDCRVTTRNYLNEGEGVGIGTSTDAASSGNFRRGFKMYTDGVQFWGGVSNTSVDNNSTIPVRIWGIKFERVNPPQVEYPNYSTEEQQVGTWMNGKPIYRKVYSGLNFGGTANAWTDTGATISNVDNIISCRGLGSDFQPLMGFRVNSNKIQYWCAQTWGNTTYIVIEYTKTTD